MDLAKVLYQTFYRVKKDMMFQVKFFLKCEYCEKIAVGPDRKSCERCGVGFDSRRCKACFECICNSDEEYDADMLDY